MNPPSGSCRPSHSRQTTLASLAAIWRGSLCSASAISTGAAAIGLALAARNGWRGLPLPQGPGSAALELVELAAHLVEGVSLAGYLARAGELAEPLTRGALAGPFWGSVLGMAASEVLRHLLPGPRRPWARLAALALGLASGFALRWAVVHARAASACSPGRFVMRAGRAGG
jgi:hypothetical protein